MLFKCLLELVLTMFLRTLAEQVDVTASCVVYPVERCLAVNETEHLNLVELVHLTCPTTNHGDGFFLAFGHTCACHFYSVNVDVLKQHTCHHQFLVRHKTHSVGLFAIAECGVHYFYRVVIHHSVCICESAVHGTSFFTFYSSFFILHSSFFILHSSFPTVRLDEPLEDEHRLYGYA